MPERKVLGGTEVPEAVVKEGGCCPWGRHRNPQRSLELGVRPKAGIVIRGIKLIGALGVQAGKEISRSDETWEECPEGLVGPAEGTSC